MSMFPVYSQVAEKLWHLSSISRSIVLKKGEYYLRSMTLLSPPRAKEGVGADQSAMGAINRLLRPIRLIDSLQTIHAPQDVVGVDIAYESGVAWFYSDYFESTAHWLSESNWSEWEMWRMELNDGIW